MSTRRLCVVVDGIDLFRAPWKLSGRAPEARELMDYAALLQWAEAEPFGERATAGHYYQRDHDAAETFHGALERLGWTLHLTPREQGWKVQKQALLAILRMLQRVDCDVLYCCGDSYGGRITKALHRLAERDGRGLAIACFDGFRTIDEGPWRVYDIVRDTGAMPETIYDPLPPSAQPPQRWTSASPPNGSDPQLATALRRAGAAPRAPAAAEQVLLLIDWHDIDQRMAAIFQRAGQSGIADAAWPQVGRWLGERSPNAAMRAAAYIEDDQDAASTASAAGVEPVVLRGFAQPGRAARTAIAKALALLIERGWRGDLYLASHDAAHLPALERLAQAGGGIYAVGFLEQFGPAFGQSRQVRLLDLERDAGAFAQPLPGRFPPIEPVDYDPLASFGDLFERGRAPFTSGR